MTYDTRRILAVDIIHVRFTWESGYERWRSVEPFEPPWLGDALRLPRTAIGYGLVRTA